jgi:hypothetical protein
MRPAQGVPLLAQGVDVCRSGDGSEAISQRTSRRSARVCGPDTRAGRGYRFCQLGLMSSHGGVH